MTRPRHAAAAVHLLAGCALVQPGVLFAHTITGNADPGAAADVLGAGMLVLLALIFAVGQWQVARRTRISRSSRALCFWSGWMVLALSLGPPLDRWSSLSFAAHMTQHELTMIVAAPLLVAARPLGTLMWGLPKAVGSIITAPTLRCWGAWLARPLHAWIVHAVVLWGWHVPVAFEAGLRSIPVHWFQHTSFFAVAVIYWWSVFSTSAAGERKALALLSVFTTAIHTAILGMLLTFSTHVWYSAYAHVANPWMLSAIEDQQLGGLIMWVPGGMVFIVAAMVLGASWLRSPSADVRTARG